MFGNFSEEARKVLNDSREIAKGFKQEYISSEHLLLAILKSENNVKKLLDNYNIKYSKIYKLVKDTIGIGNFEFGLCVYTPIVKRIIESSIIDSKDNNDKEVTVENLFINFIDEGEGVGLRILLEASVPIDELYSLLIKNKKNGTKKNKKSILNIIGINLNDKVDSLDPLIGREEEVSKVIEVLCRRLKNNPLLIGKAGTGKTAIVEGIARLIVEKKVPSKLLNKRIISVDMASLVAGTKYRGEFEEKLRNIISEVEDDKDIILFIDEIHTLVGAGGAEGAIDASNIFKPALSRGSISLIGSTTNEEYKKYIKEDEALDRRFGKIEIEEPTNDELKEILYKTKYIYEKYHNVSINDNNIDLIINLSNKYIKNKYNPDKAIDILDEVLTKVSLKNNTKETKLKKLKESLDIITNKKVEAVIDKNYVLAKSLRNEEMIIEDKINRYSLRKKTNKEVTKNDIAEVIYEKTNIPIYEIINDNKKLIKEIDNNLRNNIIGEEEAISKLIDITKKIKLGYEKENRCYSFLFVGPSGVGKTSLAKLFGKYIKGEDNVIKIDMSEFTDYSSINKLIGSPPGYVGYKDINNIFEKIKDKPNIVLILDEIEKAHPDVISLFYQIIEDSKIKDASGNAIYFNNAILIFTSNISYLKNNLGFKPNSNDDKIKEYFSIPFINRIDNVIKFKPLEEDSIRLIINKELNSLKDKYKDSQIKYNKKVIDDITYKCKYEEFGARKIKKIINNEYENIIINEIINGNNMIDLNKKYNLV